MGCAGCSTSGGSSKGCGSKGNCGTGGCNRLNTYDWLAGVTAPEYDTFDLIEVSFKNGSRKFFFHNPPHVRAVKNDMVVVESGNGYDVGVVSLTGELVKLQLKKKRIREKAIFENVIRIAHERDLEKLDEARSLERDTMIRARAISASLDLDMKIGDVEYQGDKRKATFFYTAEGRVDFRELIRHFAKDFRVKVEMRQIGARQESARIGGLGACGRELCCSTWLTNFKSVSTAAARYQNLAINQSKLSGQCGRLKCCLNFELDTYMEALKAFPKNGNVLKTEGGIAHLMKMDIFKGLMFYAFRNNKETRGKIFALKAERVKEIIAMNKKGERPESLQGLTFNDEVPEEGDVDLGFADVTGQIELPMEKRKKKKRKPNNNRNKNRQGGNKGTGNNRPQKKEGEKEGEKQQPKGQGKPNPRRKPKQNRKPNPKKQGEKPTAKNGNTNPQTKDNTAKPPTKDGKPNAEKRPNNKRGNRRPNRNNRNKNNRPPKGDGNKPTDSDKKT